LAYDHHTVKKSYVKAVKRLSDNGFREFTNYVMFNFEDDPRDFYERIRLNVELSQELGVRITGFPMKYSPIAEVSRRYVAPEWHWRYLRGIQCVLLATHGLVSPNPVFFDAAFGRNYEKFLEILSMPDRYIIFRKKYIEEAGAWSALFRKLSTSNREEFLKALSIVNRSRSKPLAIQGYSQFRALLEHYYPGGNITPCV
jgi:hypothetical protein